MWHFVHAHVHPDIHPGDTRISLSSSPSTFLAGEVPRACPFLCHGARRLSGHWENSARAAQAELSPEGHQEGKKFPGVSLLLPVWQSLVCGGAQRDTARPAPSAAPRDAQGDHWWDRSQTVSSVVAFLLQAEWLFLSPSLLFLPWPVKRDPLLAALPAMGQPSPGRSFQELSCHSRLRREAAGR